MYAYLKGTLEEIAEDAVVVEVGNIGYNVRVSATTTQGLPGDWQRGKGLHLYAGA